jgi:3',5'-cyclic AMP phosphodiesterase CpdA
LYKAKKGKPRTARDFLADQQLAIRMAASSTNTGESSDSPVRLVHFSDIHVTTRPLGWQTGDWFNKRFPAWVNLRGLGRAYRFRRADQVLAAFAAEQRKSPPDRLIFSGDATALGFKSEVAHAAHLLGLDAGACLPGLAVPGNHDYQVRAAAHSGAFEQLFAPWQKGERVDGAVYPFAQRVGETWLVAVNSSVPNRWAWDARGNVADDELDRLARLLERLAPGLRILVTHYPVCLAGGRREKSHHGLRNLDRLIEVAERGHFCLWLHGHRHSFYHHANTAWTSFPVICAGSATQTGMWSYGDYTLMDGKLKGTRRGYDESTGSFRELEQFELQLPT